ncbi:CCA tRNA nucleotidyltransferase [Paracoccus aminophilus]|uniref:PolyA polymerase n=1 Tax=Paracoccus aminophilus JCM 7686 TaxID=1367847 RepID=S5Y2P9_PARAH|nr:CCA tRNA nucleotidyltransferase [Paracoccus aminophilus]AGT10015.1 polyA polymerase [Paracoccus aminophilus JCM 7686]
MTEPIAPPRIDTSDPDLQRVLLALNAGGHQAYVVGGAVRNGLLGLAIADWDISTDAPPDRTIELGQAAGLKAVPTGIEHGTITLITNGKPFEVTTFRHDVETDGRRAIVAFTASLSEDAQRRDFTMNALYARADGAVIDPVGGLPDLAARRLRFVGHAPDRIREDYLRILRFFRFLAQYGDAGQADREALAACADLASGLAQISQERIGAEMRKLLGAADPAPSLALMAQAGVLEVILPGADPGDLAALVAAERAAGIAPAWPRRLALLRAPNTTEALRLSREESARQKHLSEAPPLPLPEAAYRLGYDLALDLALIRQGRGAALPADWHAEITAAAAETLPLSAKDLMPELQGAALGRGLQAAEKAWIDNGFAIPKADLIRIARQATEQSGLS